MKDMIVVGGGLSGLAAATFLARAGARVTLLERASELGGRARTTHGDGFALNFGPHALYAGGAGVRVLRELGVTIRGALPSTNGLLGIAGGALHTLPGGLLSILSTDLLGFGAKVDTARMLASLARIDATRLANVTVADWIAQATPRSEARELLTAFARLSTYSNAPRIESAGAALEQLKRAVTSNVYYLDDGWQTLVDGLAESARAAGVRIATGANARRIVRDGDELCGVELATGEVLAADAVVIAASPGVARALVGDALTVEASPIRAACIDLALSTLPFPKRKFALGIDGPFYFSVHSATARLAPEGGAVVHVAKYLDPDEAVDARRDEQELEGVMDLVQPGWRAHVVERRTLAAIVVANARLTAASGGKRQSPVLAGAPSVFLAGDWIDGEGMLADTALSSARDAARLALAAVGDARERSMLAAQ
jgi:phytoene dehydrogenase-like protein